MTTPQRRRIFHYFDPEKGKTVYADPLLLDMRLRKAAAGENLEEILNLFQSDVEDVYADAVERILPIAYRAFNLMPVDEATGEGTPAESILQLYISFLDFGTEMMKSLEDSLERDQDADTRSDRGERLSIAIIDNDSHEEGKPEAGLNG